jgi:rhodanese-related sulfurtransferase
MRLKPISLVFILGLTFAMADAFVGYRELAKDCKINLKNENRYASSKDVINALNNPESWIVADVRTKGEWNSAHIEGSFRIGRDSPEEMLANYALDYDNNFKRKNIILVCNTGDRASLEALVISKMGFKKVMVYDIYSWIDECQPFKTGYSNKRDKDGTGKRFGLFKAEHCYK